MEREDLERELVRKDKQTLISDCLRLYDNTEKVSKDNQQIARERDKYEKRAVEAVRQVEQIKGLSLYKLVKLKLKNWQ